MFDLIRNKFNQFISFQKPKVQHKILIIQCHPLQDSLSYEISQKLQETLRLNSHEVILRRLYCQDDVSECYTGKDFQPCLSRHERHCYNEDNIISDHKQGIFESDDVKQAVEDLRWCDSVIFIYPSWWFSQPAMLKGYFDRVLIPGVAFEINSENKKISPSLANITHVSSITSFGRSYFEVLYIGDNGKRLLQNVFLKLCHPKCNFTYDVMYNSDKVSKDERSNFIKQLQSKYKNF